MFVRRLRRLWDTVRYLKPVQIFGRIQYRLAKPTPRASVPAEPQEQGGLWVAPIAGEPSLIDPTEFRLLNEQRNLDDIGWDDPSVPRLWRYNLHYFADLNASGSRDRADWHRGLMRRWVEENPAPAGTGWEPYPTSLRIVNWIKWSLSGHHLDEALQQNLLVQLDWLTKRLEWHLLGNHLFSNAKALAFGGLYFSGPDADRWLRLGLDILKRELPEQILADGGHFERSPMYHALALEDVLDLINVDIAFSGRAGLETSLQPTAIRMLAWLQAMSHPDGDIAFFNDAAFGIAPTLADLAAYATRLGLVVPAPDQRTVVQLGTSGYLRIAMGECVALLDVAPVGPDYLPGHAHADTLSFELSVGGRRVLVNSGTSEYGLSIERLRQRGTPAHNTMTVNGLNSSDVWSGFRVGRRARPFGLEVETGDGAVRVTCSHDGYLRTSGAIHRRRWCFTENSLTVEDTCSKDAAASEVRYHLHPDVVPVASESLLLRLDGDRAIRVICNNALAPPAVEQETWHPRFGRAVPSSVLSIQLAGTATTTFTW